MPIFGCTKEDNCRKNALLRARERANQRDKERKKLNELNDSSNSGAKVSQISTIENVRKDIIEPNQISFRQKGSKETSESEKSVDGLNKSLSDIKKISTDQTRGKNLE